MNKKDNAERRRNNILILLRREGTMKLATIAELQGVYPEKIRDDLGELMIRGQIKKVRHGLYAAVELPAVRTELPTAPRPAPIKGWVIMPDGSWHQS